ncbi:MAG: exosome complex RNA-binding protein Rrp4 [Thermoprotei archaeon]
MSVYVNHRQLVSPGDLLAKGRFKADRNVAVYGDEYRSLVFGSFELREGGVLAVKALKGPYIPRRGDKVIGEVVDISMGSWTLDIRAPYEATLPAGRFPARINPVLDDIRRYLNVGDFVFAEIAEFDRSRPPILDATLNREYGPIRDGIVISVEPTRVPRIIGKKGSMVQLLNKELDVNVNVGQNGFLWIRAKDPARRAVAVQLIRKIEAEAHTSGLTSRIEEFLRAFKSGGQTENVQKMENQNQTSDSGTGEGGSS